MSKLDIGVGDEFPLEEGQPEERGQGRPWHRHGHRHGHGHHAHHHAFHHHHGRRGFRGLPLLVTIVAIAALIGTGKLSPLTTDAILGFAAVLIVLALGARFWAHRRWHANRIAQ